MSAPTEVVFHRDEHGTVSRHEPKGPWPAHIHIAAPLVEDVADPVVQVDYDTKGRAKRVTFALPDDAATYDLTPDSGLGEQVWIYGADLCQPISQEEED